MADMATIHARAGRGVGALVLTVLLVACSGSGGSAADEGADGGCSEHFEGETLTLTVGYGVGGYDDYARMLAPYLQEELGVSEVTVENQEGAGGNIQVNNLFAAEPDGLTLGLVNGVGAAGSQLTDQPGVRFDMDKFTWVGRIAYEPDVVVVDSDGGLNSFEDLMVQDPPTFGSEGPGGTNYLLPSLFREVFGEMSDLKIVTGFDAPEIELAIQRGEIDAMTGSWDSRLSQIEAGEQQPVLIVSDEPIGNKNKAFKGVPPIMGLEQLDNDGREIMRSFLDFARMGRPLAAPPGVDDNVTACLRKAFKRAATSQKLISEGAERNRPIGFLAGDKLDKVVHRAIDNAPERYIKILKESMRGE